MANKCKDCRYLYLDEICRRYPPDINHVWPHVGWHNWCGEWKSTEPDLDDPLTPEQEERLREMTARLKARKAATDETA